TGPAARPDAAAGEGHEDWDLVVVGAGPAGSSAALGALTVDPSLRVLLLDRADFPRDKSCGDGIAPHVLDALAEVGAADVVDDWTPLWELELAHGAARVGGRMRRPVHVVPREVFDARLVERAVTAGAELRRHRVTKLVVDPAGLVNPMTGEGIYYAVATGIRAGREAAAAVRAGNPPRAGAAHRDAVRRLLGTHLKHTWTAARLARSPRVVDAGIRAASRDR